jgi:hypothetical protein
MPVRIINHIVKIRQPLLLHEIPQNVHVAVRLRIRRKNVVVRDDDDLLFVPDLRRLAELALEHADRPRPADIVGHQHIRVHPDVIAGFHARLSRRPRQNLFRQRHKETTLMQYVPLNNP